MIDIHEIENELREILGPKIQCDLERMFPERKGLLARGRVKRKLNLLRNLAPSLATVLVEGERLIYAARGYLVHWWEQFYRGALVGQLGNVMCVVLTDRRILLIHTNHAGRQKLFRNQLLYTEIAEVKIRSFLSGASTFKLKDGKKLVIGGFQSTDRRYMQHYVSYFVSSMPGNALWFDRSIHYLCPRCPAIHLEMQTECKDCGTTFKSPQKAAWMSLVLPGLGDIYLGQIALGLLQVLGSLVEWGILVGAVAVVVSDGEEAATFLGFWIVLMGATNVMAFFATRAKGRDGLIAEKGSTRATFGPSITDLQSSNPG